MRIEKQLRIRKAAALTIKFFRLFPCGKNFNTLILHNSENNNKIILIDNNIQKF